MYVSNHLPYICVCVCISLGALVPNSGDQHETYGDQILHTTKHILKYVCFV